MGSLKNQDLDIKTLTQLIVGKEVFEPKNQVTPRFDLPARLRFESVSVNQNNFRKLENISFKIHPYEILGIAGIENSGQSEIVDLLVNRARLSKAQISGKIFLSDTELDLHKTQPYPLSEIALLPMDRQAQGLFGDLNLAENYLFASHSRSRWQRWGWLKQAELQKTMQRMLLAYDVRVPSPYCKASQLSGGNQQKFVVGRELDLKAKLLLACHPTRGVDVSAKAMIHQQILQFQSEANSVLLISSDLDELQNLCNRILVFYQNQIIGEVTMPCHDPSVLGQLMTGVPL
jgi:simple sugar transport system ATP-binding protein